MRSRPTPLVDDVIRMVDAYPGTTADLLRLISIW
jgi:hypothetical protein